MTKTNYVSPKMKIVFFKSEEVVTASAVVTTKDPNKPVELPFIPAE